MATGPGWPRLQIFKPNFGSLRHALLRHHAVFAGAFGGIQVRIGRAQLAFGIGMASVQRHTDTIAKCIIIELAFRTNRPCGGRSNASIDLLDAVIVARKAE